jgi:hypothetical protein
MENCEELTGGRVFARVHNGKLSNGLAFTAGTFGGSPDGCRLCRAPIMEITQIKGDGEMHPLLSPDFDPAERAFCDVRALEIPTPRWTTYDAVRFGVALPPEVSPVVQDRACSSPV